MIHEGILGNDWPHFEKWLQDCINSLYAVASGLLVLIACCTLQSYYNRIGMGEFQVNSDGVYIV